jgi:hypothetical protein
MAIVQTLTTSFKVQLLSAGQNFNTDTFKIALYTASASLSASTTVYVSGNEVPSGGTGYTAGGNTLVVSTLPTSSGTIAYISFTDSSWTSATFTTRGALIYNTTQGNAAVAIFDFGSDKSVVGGTFTVTFPPATSSTAVIRIA